jgi:hypothetical protein
MTKRCMFGVSIKNDMKTATVTVRFEERQEAEVFATLWARFSKKGHTVGSGLENVDVTVSDVEPTELDWIKEYVSK